ncbi:glycine betaine ABC transporter substrate-binding protein [Lacticigenium naphthae]|uniref:glycine betaine ABC transporter substrate-binding protein n=1 Tax=Lacticigenium naphthae TaxID=515351 RepID=UPI0003FF7311|nr:glycine betaine ABC transporter substrate-binding protein [Lacticigenium naphthae]
MLKGRKLQLSMGVSAALLLGACGNGEEADSNGDGASISEELDYTITGIEPGAGTTAKAHDTIEAYDNLEGWELDESSTAGMVTLLDQAYSNEEPIIVTGWTPHWMFQEYDLKYLEDPKNAMGESEGINTLTRLGLEEDMPNAVQILDAFEWETSDMESVMLEAQDVSFEVAAQNWIDDNQEIVTEWTEGVEEGNGETISLVSTPWDTERSSASVIQNVLESHGFEVKVSTVDPAIMFEALATQEADASLAAWLPLTHEAFLNNHKENLVDLGPNLTGAKIGMVVPTYMDIDSIEDLEPKQ